jgi:lipopolysaccharide/colanic/teichoic acid biosynthesis glycosyltransferase
MTFDERLRLDIEYIERRSTVLDLKLMAQTALAIFKGSGV